MNIVSLQRALLSWFLISEQRLKSVPSIKNTCYNLWLSSGRKRTSGEAAVNAAMSTIFEPLYRLGLIEFYGNGRFGLAPACALYNEKKILICNYPSALLPSSMIQLHDTALGLSVYERQSHHPQELLQGKIPAFPFSLKNLLTHLPSLHQIASGWEDDPEQGKTCKFVLGKRGWTKTSAYPQRGVFKTSEQVYAQRVLRMGADVWKRIPAKHIQPEAIRIARLWAQNELDRAFTFDERRKILSVKSPFFPVILERLLVTNSLLSPHPTDVPANREYTIAGPEFYHFKKLLDSNDQ